MSSTARESGKSATSTGSFPSCATDTMQSPGWSWPLRSAGPPGTSSRILQPLSPASESRQCRPARGSLRWRSSSLPRGRNNPSAGHRRGPARLGRFPILLPSSKFFIVCAMRVWRAVSVCTISAGLFPFSFSMRYSARSCCRQRFCAAARSRGRGASVRSYGSGRGH